MNVITDIITRYPQHAGTIRTAIAEGRTSPWLDGWMDAVDLLHLHTALTAAVYLRAARRRAARPTERTLDTRAEALGFRARTELGCYRGEDRTAEYTRQTAAEIACWALRSRRTGEPMPPARCLPVRWAAVL